MNLFKNEKGFTLVEILTVMVIIGILIVALAPKLDGLTQSSKINVVETDFRTMKTGIQQHYIDNREDPFGEAEIEEYLDFSFEPDAAKSNGTVIAYKTKIKEDPWGNPYYMYVNNSGNRYVLLHSYGPDGEASIKGKNFGDDIVYIFYPKN